MKRATFLVMLAGSVSAAGLLLQFGCGSNGPILLCGEIPAGGCPVGRGGTCDDPSCSGVYDCVSGDWTEVKHCAGGGTTGAASTSAASGAGGSGCGVAIDYSNETTDCTPDLETPDCPADASDSCAACEGCDDFLLCVNDPMSPNKKSWVAVAYCDPSGHVKLTPH